MADEPADAISDKRVLSALDSVIKSNNSLEKGEKLKTFLKLLNEQDIPKIFQGNEKARERLSILADSLVANYPELALPEVMEALMHADMRRENLVLDYMKSIVMTNNRELAAQFLKGETVIPNLPTSSDLMKKMAFLTDDYEHAAIIFSMNGRFDRELFSEYVSGRQTEVINSIIIKNFKEKQKLMELAEFLKLLRIATNNQVYTIELASTLRKLGDINAMKDVLSTIDIRKIDDSAQKNSLAELYDQAGESEQALILSNELLNSGFETPGIILVKAKSLLSLDRPEECLYFLQQKEAVSKKSEDLLLLLCVAGERINNYRVPLDILTNAQDTIQGNQILWKYFITFLARDSKFDLANKKLTEMENLFQNSREVLEARLFIQSTLNRGSDAINTAQRIFENDPGDDKSARLLLNAFYLNKNYKQFIEFYEKTINETIISQFRPMAASANLFVNGVDAMVQYVKKYSVNISDGHVADALIETIRTEEQIKQLQPLREFVSDSEIEIINSIVSWAKGIPMNSDKLRNIVYNSCSEKLGTIISLPSIMADPDSNIDQNVYKCARNLIDPIRETIKEIKKGGVLKNIEDYPYLNYPNTQILISMKKFKEASETLVKSTNPRNPDPYYYYLEGVISGNQGNTSNASKSLEKALSLLDSATFRCYLLKEYINAGDDKHVIAETEKIIKMGGFDVLPFSHIYEFSRKMSAEVCSNIIDLFDYSGKDNIFTMRIRRDHYIEIMDDPKAIELSKNIISMQERNARDVMTYLAVLKRSGKGSMIEEVIEILSGTDLNGEIHASFGDYYQSKGEFENAIYHYNKADAEGFDPDKMPGYADCLIELGKYSDASRIISRMKDKGILEVKLYVRSGEIERIINMLRNKKAKGPSDDEVYSFITLTLWKNSEVRNSLISLYERDGNPVLGRLIARKLLDSRDSEKAIQIMKNILKNAPNDIENAIMLCETLAKLAREEEANAILKRLLKENFKAEDLKQLFTVFAEINFNARMFDVVMKGFDDYPMLINKDSINYIVRSMIELEFYDRAEKLISKLHNKLIPQDRFDEYEELLRKKEEFAEVLYFAVRIMKLEFKAGRKLDQREAIIKAEIPVEIANEVFQFFKEMDEDVKLPAEAYDALGKETLKLIRKKTHVRSINEVTISVLFNMMQRKDPLVAKNLYIYIRRMLKEKRMAKIDDEDLNRMLRIAMKENLMPDPLNIIARFDIGLNRSLDLLALMDYVSKMNPWR
jgi:tetratricopeptide (TPR) repeat protein